MSRTRSPPHAPSSPSAAPHLPFYRCPLHCLHAQPYTAHRAQVPHSHPSRSGYPQGEGPLRAPSYALRRGPRRSSSSSTTAKARVQELRARQADGGRGRSRAEWWEVCGVRLHLAYCSDRGLEAAHSKTKDPRHIHTCVPITGVLGVYRPSLLCGNIHRFFWIHSLSR